jgi:uncharacterized protein
MSRNDNGFVSVLVDFGRALRSKGLAVGTNDILTYCKAMAPLDPTDLVDLYWAGRTTLIMRREDIVLYNEVFRAFFLASDSPVQKMLKVKAQSAVEAEAPFEIPATEPSGKEQEEETLLGLMASNVETLKHRSFGECTPEELAALRRIMARIKLTPPKRRTRRTKTGADGRRPDMRRTIRESLRTHGEMIDLYWRQRRVRQRPLILILDVSGSMADYSRALLQFAYSAKRGASHASQKVEVFCFGTRLSCVTKPLQTRRPDEALERAAKLVVDWEGGTRIGDSIDKFVRLWARRGMCRGGVVVICSDGLDRGDPELLSDSMERLSRLCHNIVWMNPHKGNNPDYQPQTVGMMAAQPYIDVLLSGHDLSSLEELATLLPKLG